MYTRRIPLLALGLFLFCNCDKDNQKPVPEPPKDTLSIEFDEKNVSERPVEFTLKVEANCEWSFSIDSNWVYVIEPRSKYSGNGILTIKVKANETVFERKAVMSFLWANGRDSLRIIQEPFKPYLEVSENTLSFGYRTAEKVILIKSNCGWEASSGCDWLAFKPSTGLVGNFDMAINVGTNVSGAGRNATVRIYNAGYSLEQFVDISQDAKPAVEEKNYIDEYGIDHGAGIIVRGLAWAPVNCGYKEQDFPFGKMFQWGRKYGVGYHDTTFSDSGKTIISEIWNGDNGAEDSSTFYKYSDGSKFGYDWIMNGNDSFWNLGTEENPVKNKAFDPCPDGWRIPTSFELRSLVEYVDRTWTSKDGINGYDVSGLFLPACGRLNVLDGASYDRNIEGYYWTISGKNGSSPYLFFYEKDCNINSQGSRAGGCAVRCVRE